MQKQGVLKGKGNKLDGANELLEYLIKTDPQDKDILYNLGMCYTELDEPDKAVKTMTECVRCYPNYSNAYVALGFAHSRLAVTVSPQNAHEVLEEFKLIINDNYDETNLTSKYE